MAIEEKRKFTLTLSTGECIKVNSVFDKQHVFLHDEKRSLALNSLEWIQFLNSLSLVYICFVNLAPNENAIEEFTAKVLELTDSKEVEGAHNFPSFPAQLPP